MTLNELESCLLFCSLPLYADGVEAGSIYIYAAGDEHPALWVKLNGSWKQTKSWLYLYRTRKTTGRVSYGVVGHC